MGNEPFRDTHERARNPVFGMIRFPHLSDFKILAKKSCSKRVATWQDLCEENGLSREQAVNGNYP